MIELSLLKPVARLLGCGARPQLIALETLAVIAQGALERASLGCRDLSGFACPINLGFTPIGVRYVLGIEVRRSCYSCCTGRKLLRLAMSLCCCRAALLPGQAFEVLRSDVFLLKQVPVGIGFLLPNEHRFDGAVCVRQKDVLPHVLRIIEAMHLNIDLSPAEFCGGREPPCARDDLIPPIHVDRLLESEFLQAIGKVRVRISIDFTIEWMDLQLVEADLGWHLTLYFWVVAIPPPVGGFGHEALDDRAFPSSLRSETDPNSGVTLDVGSVLRCGIEQVPDGPWLVRYAHCHGGRRANRPVPPDEVVVPEMERHGRLQALTLLAERVRQPG